MKTLSSLLDHAAAAFPDRTAVEATDGDAVTFRVLHDRAERVTQTLRAHGVRPGDRVGIYAAKSIDTVAALFGVLGAGAAYVPLDPDAPVARAAYIAQDCAVRAVLGDPDRVAALRETLPDNVGTAAGNVGSLTMAVCAFDGQDAVNAEDPLAYILYTSGSTGRPKGVMISHGNALSFVDWCADVFDLSEHDRFSSHAPFHFDLSIFDLYVCVRHGATLVLIDAFLAKLPDELAAFIAARRITVWYSTPSILSLIVQFSRLDTHEVSALRYVLFAGEVFPIKYLRALKDAWPRARYVNLYGPTETNVCTYFEVPPSIPDDRDAPYPIGHACTHARTTVMRAPGEPAASGEEGELYVAGDPVMQGYWNLPERTAQAFYTDASGTRWYRTGDVVQEDAAGDYLFLGRRDRMVKRRGYRIELGEIEAALYRHDGIAEAAVVARSDDEGTVIHAYVHWVAPEKPSIIRLKRFCSDHLPLYMIPDRFLFVDHLPKTSTDKVDYQELERISE